MSSLRKLFLHFGHFFSGSALSLLLGLVTFPILTRLLSREDYGILGLVTTTTGIAAVFAKGGISDGIIRFYRDYADDRQRLAEFTSTVVARTLVLTTATTILYLAVLPGINRYLGIDGKYLICFQVMALSLFVQPLNGIVRNYLRVLGQTLFLNTVNIASKVAGIALAFALFLVVIHQLYGYFLGTALAEFAAGIVFFRWFLSNYDVALNRISKGLTLNLFKFGLPLLLTELSYFLLAYVDRYMIAAYHGAGMVGVYSVGYNLPSYINNLLMFSLSYAIVPIYTEMYAAHGRGATEEFLSRALRYYMMAVIPLCVGYYSVSREMLVLLASPKYLDAASFSPIILLGLVFLGMNSILYAGLYLEKKSLQILAIMGAAVAINVALNLVLLPDYGTLGAAIATLVACVSSTILTIVLSFRYIRVRFCLPTIAYYLAASTVMAMIIMRVNFPLAWLNLLAKMLLGTLVLSSAILFREREIRSYAMRIMLPGRSS